MLTEKVQKIRTRNKIRLRGSSTSAVGSYGVPVTVAGDPSTSPVSDMRTISVRPSIEVVESFTRPAHRMKTPRGACAFDK